MKKIFLLFGVLMFSFYISSSVKGQELKEHIVREFTLSDSLATPFVAIYNTFGSIKVEGYEGNKIIIEIDKTIVAPDTETLETGEKKFDLQFVKTGDSVIVYLAGAYDTRPIKHVTNENEKWEVQYKYYLNYTVKVPSRTSLTISTVNKGEIRIKNVSGILDTKNVNGGISIVNAKSATKAITINGSITVNYISNPSGESFYRTVNGDIVISCKKDLMVDIEYKTKFGRIYSDFVSVAGVSNTQEKSNTGVKNISNRYNQGSMRIGKGGNTFRFESLTGTIYLKMSERKV